MTEHKTGLLSVWLRSQLNRQQTVASVASVARGCRVDGVWVSWSDSIFLRIVDAMNESRIADLRRARGWTQERLASQSGVAVRTIQRLEGGRDAGLVTISLIANAFGVSVQELFVSVEGEEFQTAVEGLDVRTSAQQSRRDTSVNSFKFLYQGLGVLVTLTVIMLFFTGTLGFWSGWFIVSAYWAVGGYVLCFLIRVRIDPWLAAKYPLSRVQESRMGSEQARF
jgi:transcriptional regulator with XRE-family HTH domain